MPASPDPSALSRSLALGLPFVVSKRMFGREAFFTAGRMFAFLTEASLVLRLPEPERSDLLRAGLARPFLGEGIPTVHGWVEVGLSGEREDRLHRLLVAGHEAVRRLSKSSRHRRSRTRARRLIRLS